MAFAVMVVGLGLASLAVAQAAGADAASTESSRRDVGASPPHVIVPDSSIEKPGDAGKRAHTHYEILDTHGPIVPPNPRSVPKSKHVR
jgi:hypothetical protein